jgi:hypothetical protein
VEVSSKIPGCLFYESESNCQSCKLGYLSVINDTCVKNYIKFCSVQKNFEECLLCENGLIKNGDCVNSDTCQNIDLKCKACYYEEITSDQSVISQTGIETQAVPTSKGNVMVLFLVYFFYYYDFVHFYFVYDLIKLFICY